MESSPRGEASTGAHREMERSTPPTAEPRQQDTSSERATQTSHPTAGGIRKGKQNRGHKRTKKWREERGGNTGCDKGGEQLYL